MPTTSQSQKRRLEKGESRSEKRLSEAAYKEAATALTRSWSAASVLSSCRACEEPGRKAMPRTVSSIEWVTMIDCCASGVRTARASSARRAACDDSGGTDVMAEEAAMAEEQAAAAPAPEETVTEAAQTAQTAQQ